MQLSSNPILEILISLVLIYALLSILASIINELISHLYEERADMLRDSIVKLLKDAKNADYGELFFNHINIQAITRFKSRRQWFGLFKNTEVSKKKLLPSYISSSLFADTVIDTIAAQAKHLQGVKPLTDAMGNLILDAEGRKIYTAVGDAPPELLMDRFRAALDSMNPSGFRDVLQSFNDKANGEFEKLKPLLENWFNDYQDRVSGWYKTKQRNKLIWIGLATAVFLNADSLHLIKVLSLDDKLRGELVVTSERVADNYSQLADSSKNNITSLISTFTKKDSTDKTLIDSLYKKDSLLFKKPGTLADVLRSIDSVKFKEAVAHILLEDSISKGLEDQSEEVLGIAAELNIPIGYNENSAPLSWWNHKAHKLPPASSKNAFTKKERALLAYNKKRNAWSPGNFWTYLFGILITGFSLSVGAPFWFSLLLKLVDIRRAGIKPVTNPKKDS